MMVYRENAQQQQCDGEILNGSLPNKYVRGLNHLHVDYPGCNKDLSIARKSISSGSKKDSLKVFCKLKFRTYYFFDQKMNLEGQ